MLYTLLKLKRTIMDLFNVYPLWNIEPVKGEGCRIWDKDGVEYLDLYGGHAVISVGHSHPVYTKKIKDQVEKLGFYSNAVQNGLQKELAKKLGEICGYPDYSLFLCNSGAEANENAFKLASFHTGRKKILAMGKAFQPQVRFEPEYSGSAASDAARPGTG